MSVAAVIVFFFFWGGGEGLGALVLLLQSVVLSNGIEPFKLAYTCTSCYLTNRVCITLDGKFHCFLRQINATNNNKMENTP